MTLTREEQDILDGKKGDVLAKVNNTVVEHANAFGADKLVNLGALPTPPGPYVSIPILAISIAHGGASKIKQHQFRRRAV